jgi:MFS superfamily sulfate permease-like transporter
MGDTARFGELSAALAILVGLVLVALGVLHVGFVSRFISASVQAGFMFGLGLTIIVGQVPALLDVLTALRGELFQRGVALWLANARAEVQDLLRSSGLAEAVGEARIYRSLADAIPDGRAAPRS